MRVKQAELPLHAIAATTVPLPPLLPEVVVVVVLVLVVEVVLEELPMPPLVVEVLATAVAAAADARDTVTVVCTRTTKVVGRIPAAACVGAALPGSTFASVGARTAILRIWRSITHNAHPRTAAAVTCAGRPAFPRRDAVAWTAVIEGRGRAIAAATTATTAAAAAPRSYGGGRGR